MPFADGNFGDNSSSLAQIYPTNKLLPPPPECQCPLIWMPNYARTFHLLYSAGYAGTRDTLSHIGIETGDGWFDIIYELSVKLENLIEKLPPEERKNYYAVQVKEKFGLLNFSMSKETEEMRSLIGEAEGKSASTCEECGQPGNYVAGVGSRLCARLMLPIGDTYSR